MSGYRYERSSVSRHVEAKFDHKLMLLGVGRESLLEEAAEAQAEVANQIRRQQAARDDAALIEQALKESRAVTRA